MQRHNRLIILIFLSIIGIHCEAAQKQSRQMVVPFNLKTNPWWHDYATPMRALKDQKCDQWRPLKRTQTIVQEYIPTIRVPKKIVGGQERYKGRNNSPAKLIRNFLMPQQMALVKEEELEKYWVGKTPPNDPCFGDNRAGDAQRAFLKMQVRSNYYSCESVYEKLLKKSLAEESPLDPDSINIVANYAYIDIAKEDLSFRELHEYSSGRTWMPDYPDAKGEEEDEAILENIIQLITPPGSRYSKIIVGPNDRMSDLRKKIAEVSGVPVEQQTVKLIDNDFTDREIKRLLDCALYLTDRKDRVMIVGDARYQY